MPRLGSCRGIFIDQWRGRRAVFFKIWKPYSEVPLRFTTSPYFGRRRATERVEAGSAHLLGQPSGPPTALGDEWDWAPGLFYRTDLGRATTSRCIVRPARGRVIFAWRHGQLDDSSVRKLAIRIREKITQARKICRVVMTADARAVWKDAYETLSQGRPGLPGERRSLLGVPSSSRPDNHLPSCARDIDEPLFGAFESFDATAVWVAVNSRPRAFRCGRLVWIKEGWSWEERVSESVGNGDDSPTISISFEVYEVLAV